ncbi:glycosyltransferase family 61 protein [Paenibacillus humicola]|uniref:glycosyltransferase family 61 protein n=1 Tax=Paenibacillus humicola TaxID=3110540 RepID=UPI00237A644B|nr:glycosyltransferase 61 family protein [Paenibacillus humicola]
MVTIARALQRLVNLDGYEFITELYKELLSREPHAAEFDYCANMLDFGTPKLTLVAELLQSEESALHNVLRNTDAPKGAYWSTLEWFHTFRAQFPNSGAVYMPLPSDDSAISFDQPGLPFLFDPGMPPQQFVAVVPEGRVAGPSGSVISPDNMLLWDVGIEFNKPAEPQYHSVFSEWSYLEAASTRETVGVLTSPGSYNYYHWMFDVLPRIEMMRQSGLQVDRYVVNRAGGHAFQQETLEMFGISEEQLIECGEHLHLKARRLVVPSMAGFSGHMPKLACVLLRQAMLTKGRRPAHVQSRRIYISRSLAENRRILNEHEVIEHLQRFGFQPLTLETMSVAEQIAVFADAEAVVAPHGAGLANLVFCRPGTKIVELYHPGSVNPCYLALCQKVGLVHRGIVGEEHPSHPDRPCRPGDMDVDIGRLNVELQYHAIL